MPNARNKNRARLQSVCTAQASKRTGGHSAFVSRNQAYALAFLALIGHHRLLPPMRYHSRDIAGCACTGGFYGPRRLVRVWRCASHKGNATGRLIGRLKKLH